MANSRNPFVDDICFAASGEQVGTTVPMYGGAMERIIGELPVGQGVTGARVILLLAPRAGFGKTHLLSTVVEKFQGRAVPIRLEFNPDCPVSWSSLFSQLLEAFELPEEGDGEVTRLDVAVRFLLAHANRKLIDSGVIPCGNRWEADSALARDYVELFDFSNPRQVVAKWFGANFHKLAPHAAKVIGRELGMAVSDCEAWLASLCAYAESIGDPTAKRSEALRWGLRNQVGASVRIEGMEISSDRGNAGGADKKRVLDFCRLVGLHRPVVFLLDHLDGFHGDLPTGQKLAYFISELQQHLPRKLTILSLNEDLWESAFKPGLPSAFEDRLTGNVVNLTGVDISGARALVAARLRGERTSDEESAHFLAFLRLEDYFNGQAGKLISPRVVLRYAALHWDVYKGGTDGAEIDTEGANGEPEVLDQNSFLLFPEEGESNDVESGVLGDEIQGVIASAADVLEGAAKSVRPAGRDEGARKNDGAPNPFQRLKGMLLELREERAGGPAHVELDQAADSRVDAPPASPQSIDPSSPDAKILAEFFAVRERIEPGIDIEGGALKVDVAKVRNLVRIAGKRFPVVSYDEFELPQSGGQDVVKWAYGDNEIYFGFEDGSQEDFWAGLADFVGARTETCSESAVSRLKAKIVAFSAPGGEGTFHSIRNGDTPWDVICLEKSALAALYATDELICRAESGELDAEPGQILGILASQLEFFWKRVTRLKCGGEPAKP